MKNLLLIAFLVFCGFKLWGKYQENTFESPVFDKPYIAVYGRDSCGYTQHALKQLKNSGVDYHYFKVDNQKVADSLHEHMRSSGISTRRYNLPVIDVSGKISVRPNLNEILSSYSESF